MLTHKEISEKRNEMVLVAVRCRPMNDEEKHHYSCALRVEPSRNSVEIIDTKNENSGKSKTFTFDATFDGSASQCEIYDKMVRPLVDAVLCGYNGTVFAYGQSGSGKTYTMEGLESDDGKGILPRTSENIFEHVSKSCNIQFLIRTSYLEIYQDEIRDLLNMKNGGKYEVRESKDSGIYVKDISSFVCKSEKEMNMIIEAGRRNRTTAATNINERSSRSHAIVTITVEMKDLTGPSEGRVRVGKLNLVDLAGSERQSKTNADGDRLKEANKINLSLSVLGNVIYALSENKNHIPYRESKLTHILKDSLGGNSKTLMIANIGPCSYNYNESLNTLRYASRAKKIRNNPQVNEDPVDTLIRRYQEEIKKLKQQLLERTGVKKHHSKDTLERLHVNKKKDSSASLNLKEPSITGKDDCSSTEEKIVEHANCNDGKKNQQIEDVNQLKKRIALMEGRLLIGDKNILDHTTEQRKSLEEHTHEINKIKKREKEMHESLEKENEITEEVKEDFNNLKQEIETKSKKLSKLCMKLEAIKQEIIYAKEEFNADRRELELAQNEILKEIKLKFLIMENFIPNEKRRKMLPRLFYDEDLDSWQLEPNVERYTSTPRSPLTVGKSNGGHNEQNGKIQRTHRFKEENILELGLIQSTCTTKDYKPPKLSLALNTIFQAAMKLEEDIDIDAASSSSCAGSHLEASRHSLESILKPKLETDPRRTKSAANLPVYPKARGLVRK